MFVSKWEYTALLWLEPLVLTLIGTWQMLNQLSYLAPYTFSSHNLTKSEQWHNIIILYYTRSLNYLYLDFANALDHIF